MTQLTQQQVDYIAARVAGILGTAREIPRAGTAVSRPGVAQEEPAPGIFPGVDAAVQAAGRAQKALSSMTLEKRVEIIAGIRRSLRQAAEELSRLAVSETGLGRVEDKLLKHHLVLDKTPGPEILKPSAVSGDRGLTLVELAPYGVIGSITPLTNPTTTIIGNAIAMLAAGNAVVFNAHPAARQVSAECIVRLNQAIVAAGGPPNLVAAVAEPTLETARELMQHPGVHLLVVTGGAGVVKAALRSGKRAICAGPGNPPVVVDESADIENAARCIVQGASLDNNVVCVLEKEIFVVEAVADKLLGAFARHAAVVLQSHQIEQLDKVLFATAADPRQAAVINKHLVGKNIQDILGRIGLRVEDRMRLAVAPVSLGHPLVWTEQMLPVIPLVKMPSAGAAIDSAREAEHGYRHTAVMHSRNLDNLSRMAREMDCSIFVKNGSSLAGLGFGGEGYCSFTIASPTGEGLTNPRSFARERRCVLVDHFRIV